MDENVLSCRKSEKKKSHTLRCVEVMVENLRKLMNKMIMTTEKQIHSIMDTTELPFSDLFGLFLLGRGRFMMFCFSVLPWSVITTKDRSLIGQSCSPWCSG
jgi:hypothetical protein